MAFTKGNSYGTGRPKGAGNKVSNEIRSVLNDFTLKKVQAMDAKYEKLSEKDQLTFLLGLFKYSVPQLASTELYGDFDRMSDEQLEYVLEELKKEMNQNLNKDDREE